MRKLGIVLLVVLMLAACTPTNDGGRTTKDAGRRTNDERRTTIVAVTVTPVPTLTATPLPTATATPTATPTPTRTLTLAESRAASLSALPGFSWRADGDSVKLYDAKDEMVAILDQKTGGLRWDSQKHFDDLNNFIKADAKPEDRAAIASWMKQLKDQGIQFITYPDTRKDFPPYLLTLSPDGKDVKMIAAKKGTADFIYNADAKKVMAVFPDASGYYFVNPDGKFDFAPLEAQAKAIAQSLRDRGVIQHPDPAKADFIQQATASAIMINPYGATPKEINDFILSRTGKDFAEHFNRTWGDKVGVTYEQVMAATLAQSPKDVFGHVSYIGKVYDPRCLNTCGVTKGWSATIQFVESDLTSSAYYPTEISALKESLAGKTFLEVWREALYQGKTSEFSKDKTGAHIAEALSFTIQAYTLNQHPEISPHSGNLINESIDSAFRGGWVVGE